MKRKRSAAKKTNAPAAPPPPRNISIGNARFTVHPSYGDCATIRPYPQGPEGVCWFGTVMAIFFISELMRTRVLHALPQLNGWKVPIIQMFVDMFFLGKPYAVNMSAARMLRELQCKKPNVFNKSETNVVGGYSGSYISRFLNFFEIPHAFFMRDGESIISEPSQWNLQTPFDRNRRHEHLQSGRATLAPYVSMTSPDVIIVETIPSTFHARSRMLHKNLPKNVHDLLRYTRGPTGLLRTRHALNLKFGTSSYRLDSVEFRGRRILPNKSVGRHSVAGVTCGGQRFIYNGWESSVHHAVSYVSQAACHMQPFNWVVPKEFSILSGHCDIKPPDPRAHVFHTVNNTLAVYVRVA